MQLQLKSLNMLVINNVETAHNYLQVKPILNSFAEMEGCMLCSFFISDILKTLRYSSEHYAVWVYKKMD